MEKVWKELEKIEEEGKHVRSESLRNSEKIIGLAKQEAEKLVSASRKHAEEEADEMLNACLDEANKKRAEALKKNEEVIKKLRTAAKKHVDEAIKMIFHAVLGKNKV